MLLPFMSGCLMLGTAHGGLSPKDLEPWNRKRRRVDLSDIEPIEEKIIEHVVSRQTGSGRTQEEKKAQLEAEFARAEIAVRDAVFKFYLQRLAEEEEIVSMLLFN